MTVYIESSAAMKLFIEEAESNALEHFCDALHIAAAVRAGVTAFVTDDERQRDAALGVGLTVQAPA